jgi:hypothetical protein
MIAAESSSFGADTNNSYLTGWTTTAEYVSDLISTIYAGGPDYPPSNKDSIATDSASTYSFIGRSTTITHSESLKNQRSGRYYYYYKELTMGETEEQDSVTVAYRSYDTLSSSHPLNSAPWISSYTQITYTTYTWDDPRKQYYFTEVKTTHTKINGYSTTNSYKYDGAFITITGETKTTLGTKKLDGTKVDLTTLDIPYMEGARPSWYIPRNYVNDITRCISVWADVGERLIIFTDSSQPFTDGTLCTSTSYTEPIWGSGIETTGPVYADDLRTHPVLVSYITSTANSSSSDQYFKWSASSLTTSVTGFPSSIVLTTAVSLWTVPIEFPGGSGFNFGWRVFDTYESFYLTSTKSSSTSGTFIAVVGGIQRTMSSTRTYSGQTTRESALSSGSTTTYLTVGTPTISYPVFNPVYIIASSQSGWVVPSTGFHTREPSSTLEDTFEFLTVGLARPNVSLYVPLAGPTPILPTERKTYFAGEGYGLRVNSTTKASIGATATVDFLNGTDVSPSVFNYRTEGATQISRVRPKGTVDTYENRGAYIGGCSGVSWTLVVGSPGIVVEYCDNSSTTSDFSGFTTVQYAGTKGSLISFIPNASFEFFNPSSVPTVIVNTVALYDYAE